MKTFYFDTGVKPYAHNPPVKIGKGQVLRGGTLQIPFSCENVPDNAQFGFASDDPNKKELDSNSWICREIFNSTLVSKYAYFFVNKP